MSYGGQDSEEGFSGINVTPLTDVMLVLLITFLLSASSFESNELSVPLPQVKQTADIERHAEVLAVDLEGRVQWAESAWSELEPEEAFRRLQATSAKDVLALGVHRECEYGRVFPIVKAATDAGWSRIVLLTEESL